MVEENKDLTAFVVKSMNTTLLSEILERGQYRYLQNIRVFSNGSIKSRPKINIISNLTPPKAEIIHSIKTIVDKATGTKMGVVGIDGSIYTGPYNNLTEQETGYSGKPNSMIAFRSEQAISPSVIIADENKMSEATIDGNVGDLGLNAPNDPPTYKIVQADRKIIDNCDDAGVWVRSGVASGSAIVSRINTTISQIIYDVGTDGLCSVVPVVMSPDLIEGTILKIAAETPIYVEMVLKSNLSQTLITALNIIDATNINLTLQNSYAIEVNSIVKIAAGIYGRVLEVIDTTNTNYSYKCVVPDTSLINVGDTIVGIPSFRCYTATTKAIGNTITASALQVNLSGVGIGAITKTANIDLTKALVRNIDEKNGIVYFAVAVSALAAIESFQIQFIIDTANYYWKEIGVNEFFAVTSQLTPDIAIKQELAQRQNVSTAYNNAQIRVSQFTHNSYIPYGTEEYPIAEVIYNEIFTALGDGQYSIFKIPLSAFTRSGVDESRGWRDITKTKFSFKALAAVDILVDSIWFSGGALPTATDNFLAYNYVYRYEIENGGHISNWSPPFRNGIRFDRTTLELFATASVDPRIDVITFARFGGNINSFRILGKKKNDILPFIDEYSDLIVADNPRADRDGAFDYYKPFPILDKTRTGKCNVTGHVLERISGDNLNGAWPRGTAITVDGILAFFYNHPKGESVELEKSLGNLTNVDFVIKNPIMVGQPLPIIFGPFGEGSTGIIHFGIGGNDGSVYWLDPNSIATASNRNRLEITSPAEPLMAGVMYDNIGYIATRKGWQQLIPTYNTGVLSFVARGLAGSHGLYGRYALCASNTEGIFYESDDGIYNVRGAGIPISITDDFLYNLFPHEGTLPIPITFEDGTIIYPPDFTLPDQHRLYIARGNVNFRYINTNGEQTILVYDMARRGWISNDTFPNNLVGAIYEDEEESDHDILVGLLGQVGIFAEGGTFDADIASKVIEANRDYAEPTLAKLFQEFLLDANLGMENIDVSLLLDTPAISKFFNIVGTFPAERKIYTYGTVDETSVAVQIIYDWPLSDIIELFRNRINFIPKSNIITDAASDFLDQEFLGEKFWERLILEADTFGENKKILLETDDGITYDVIEIINHTGQQTRHYSFEPFIAHKVRIKSEDGVKWIRYSFRFIADIEAELGTLFKTQKTNHNIIGSQHVQLISLAYVSDVNLIFTHVIDNVEYDYSFPASTGGKQQRFTRLLKPVRGELFEYYLKSATGDGKFRFYKRHSFVHVKSMNAQDPYQIVNPWGDISRQNELKNV